MDKIFFAKFVHTNLQIKAKKQMPNNKMLIKCVQKNPKTKHCI